MYISTVRSFLTLKFQLKVLIFVQNLCILLFKIQHLSIQKQNQKTFHLVNSIFSLAIICFYENFLGARQFCQLRTYSCYICKFYLQFSQKASISWTKNMLVASCIFVQHVNFFMLQRFLKFTIAEEFQYFVDENWKSVCEKCKKRYLYLVFDLQNLRL